MDEPIPGVEPTERTLELPREWITTTGKIRWSKLRGKLFPCEDCIHLVLDHVNGGPGRPPGLPWPAVWRRKQAGQPTLHCQQHHDLRIKKEVETDERSR